MEGFEKATLNKKEVLEILGVGIFRLKKFLKKGYFERHEFYGTIPKYYRSQIVTFKELLDGGEIV